MVGTDFLLSGSPPSHATLETGVVQAMLATPAAVEIPVARVRPRRKPAPFSALNRTAAPLSFSAFTLDAAIDRLFPHAAEQGPYRFIYGLVPNILFVDGYWLCDKMTYGHTKEVTLLRVVRPS